MPTAEANKADIATVTALIYEYVKKISQSDLEAMLNFYASDAVLMAEYNDPCVGVTEIRRVYQGAFEMFSLNATIAVDEVVQMAPDWIFARCHSSGTMTVKAAGQSGPFANQELFIFGKGGDGSWKIARYSFSSTNPPPQP